MARIRTVKPDLFRHEDLFMAEIETELPLRLAYIGLFTVCDRVGRFKWRPGALKLDVLPYDSIDFERVLDALSTRGYLVKYASSDASGENVYGCIPTFLKHQHINNRELESKLPNPDDCEIISTETSTSTRASRVPHASAQMQSPARAPGKGKGNMEEEKIKIKTLCANTEKNDGKFAEDSLRESCVKNKKPCKPKFQKPTFEQLSGYCCLRNQGIDPAVFLDHYESNGWMVGRTPMKDWKAAVRTWERNSYIHGGCNGIGNRKPSIVEQIEAENKRRQAARDLKNDNQSS